MHKLNVKEKYYTLLKTGDKTIELRLNDDKRKAIRIGETIEFTNASNLKDSFLAEVVNLHYAESFAALCQKIDCVQAGMANKEELLNVVKEFYPEERQKTFGVVGIEIKRI